MFQARLRSLTSARPATLRPRALLHPRLNSTYHKPPKWGIFSDIHFQQEDLPRILSTSNWIQQVFRDAQVSQIFCLGDVINTREHVNVQALSATAKFFDDLRKIAPVHIVLGNHDMNLKHSSKVSSLDFFDTKVFQGSCELYRDFKDVEVEGVKCLFVPWVENHSLVVERFEQMTAEEKAKRILFGHLAVSGAVQQPSVPVTSRYRTHTGVLKGRHLVDFRGTYLGHFHHYQQVGEGKVWYIGSPMQHHFGDKGDANRGVVILHPEVTADATQAPRMEFIQNPSWDFFREISLQNLRDVGFEGLPFDVAGKRISVRCNAVDAAEYEAWRGKLMKAGASDVRRKVEIGQKVFSSTAGTGSLASTNSTLQNNRLPGTQEDSDTKDSESQQAKSDSVEETFRAPTTATFIESLPAFLNTVETELVPEDQRADYIATAERLMNLADTTATDGAFSPTSTNSSLPVFQATLRSLTIQNFFSIQGTLTIPLSELNPGIWFLTGPNGSGKSTVLEAVVWCLFGEVLRSDMSAGDPVNDVVGKNCCVRVEFENGYAIERFRKFTSKGVGSGPGLKLYKNGVEVVDFERGEMRKTQAALERDIIGCNMATFTKSVIFGDQGGGAGNFLTLDIKQRRDVLEELLGIGKFEGYLKAVREERKVLEREHLQLRSHSDATSSMINRLNQEYVKLQATVSPKEKMRDSVQQKLDELEKEVVKFTEDRTRIEEEQGEMLRWNKVYESLQRAQERRRLALEQLRLREEKIYEAQKSLEKIEQAKPFHGRWTSLVKETDRGQGVVRVKTLEHRNTSDRLEEIQDSLETFNERLGKGVCPTCRQSLDDPTHVQEHLDLMRQDQADLGAKLRKLALDLDDAKKSLKEQEEKQIALVAELQERGITLAYLNSLSEREREARHIIQINQTPMNRIQAEVTIAEKELTNLLAGKTLEEINSLAHPQGERDVSALQKLMFTYTGLLKRIQEIGTRRMSLNSSLAKLTTEVLHATSQLKTIREQLTDFSQELEGSSERIAHLEKDLRILLFWETSFNKKLATTTAPNMRHFLISSSINELNSLIQANMEILTNNTPTMVSSENSEVPQSPIQQLPIFFTPDLSIHPPSSFGKRSSGQRKRNNLAVLFALFQLIRQKSRFRADFIMLDEVFDALDKQGQIQAAELISAITTESRGVPGEDGGSAGGIGAGEVKHVLVVTHSDALEDVVRVGNGGAGARVLRVKMGESGTEITDPEGVIVHFQGVKSGEEGVPDIVMASEEGQAKKRRKKAKSAVAEEEGAVGEEESMEQQKEGLEESDLEVAVPVKKRRGGKRKTTTEEQPQVESEDLQEKIVDEEVPVKKRTRKTGETRKKRAVSAEEANENETVEEPTLVEESEITGEVKKKALKRKVGSKSPRRGKKKEEVVEMEVEKSEQDEENEEEEELLSGAMRAGEAGWRG